MNLGPMEIGLILFAILLLFGYKKLPDASRSFGRSLRIFKGEMTGMADDDLGTRNPTDSRLRSLAGPAALAPSAGTGRDAGPAEQFHHGGRVA